MWWPCWPASAPTATCAWSRAGAATPSVPVLDSIARVLQLDDVTYDFLLGLVVLLGLAVDKPRRRSRPRKKTIPSGVVKLLAALGLSAFMADGYLEILAANPLATRLSSRPVAGANRLLDSFLGPADPRFIQLVGELSLGSPHFRQLWARHDVGVRQVAPIRFNHLQGASFS